MLYDIEVRPLDGIDTIKIINVPSEVFDRVTVTEKPRLRGWMELSAPVGLRSLGMAFTIERNGPKGSILSCYFICDQDEDADFLKSAAFTVSVPPGYKNKVKIARRR